MDGFLRQAPAPFSARARGVPARASIAGEAIHEEAEMSMAFSGYERSSSAEARGLEGRAPLQQEGGAWDRCNSADGMDPCVAKQLASAVEDKLKLAPILAKRLERVSHSSGSFSSRQSLAMANHLNPSGRSTPQRPVPASDYSKLNYLVTSLEGVRGERNLKVEGSARLPQVGPPLQSGSPTTARNDNSHSFEEAKRQVDRDLRLFLADVRDLYQQISLREGADVPIVLEVIASIMDIAEECLETPVEDFKLTITDIVDNIEEERSACQQRTIRALYTRLLFILTRCSRLLITEQQHLFATEPRNRRRHSQVFGPGLTIKTQKDLGLHLPPQSLATDAAGTTPKEEDEPVFRSHTMPVKAMYNMVQQLKREGPASQTQSGWTDNHHQHHHHQHQLSRIESELPESPGIDSQEISGTVVRHQSKSSDLEAIPSISDGSMSSLTKKKKGFFGKISKGLKSFTDGFKRKSSKDKDGPDGLMRPHSEIAGNQQVRFRAPETNPKLAPSSGPSLRGQKSAALDGSDAGSEPAPQRRLDNQRSVRFQETPVHIVGSSENMAAGARGGGAMSSNGGSEADTGKRAKLSVNTEQEEQRGSDSPQASSELEMLAGGGGRGNLFRRASVDLYAMGMNAGLEPMSPDGMPPEDLTVICSICEEAWLSTHLEEHSIHCAVLRTLSGNGLSIDAQLTTVANVLEEWLETPLAFPALGPAPSHYHVKNQLIKLIRAARNAAALQPDGSKVPTTRCFSIQAELSDMLETAAQANKLAIVTQTYAHRVMRLMSEKVNLLAEPFGGTRVRAGGGSDAGDSGTSTPRSMPGMSIDEFEIIKPISRGAFGRVYLARKLATGDLFAIKVMKKRDLIRKNMVESVTNERNILAMAQNPFVVRFYYSFTSRENLYIVMEYINGGDCFSLLRKFGALDEEVARQYIAETVLALEYCHAQGIIHRDLKPDNLLINAQGHVKLTDFGLSCVGVIDRTDNLNGSQPMDTDGPEQESESAWGGGADANGDFSNSGAVPAGAAGGSEPMDASKPDEGPTSSTSQDGGAHGRTSVPGQSRGAAALRMPPRPLGQHQRIVAPEHECRRAVGTPDYLAPELLLGTGHGPEVDWWALGTILYEFVTGTPPFNADTPEEIFDNILDRRITWPDEDDMSAECRDLIDKLLHPNPLKRLGHRGAGEVKLHPWFEGLDWTGLVRNKAAFIPAVEDETDTSYFESKHVSQRSMAEDLDKLRTSAPAERTSAHAQGPNSSPMVIPGSGPSSGMGGGRTQVDRLKDQYHREGSGMRSVGSSNSHGSSHMSRTSYTGNAGAESIADMARLCHSPFQAAGMPFGVGPDSGIPLPPGSCGRSSATQGLLSGLMHPLHPRNSVGSSSCGGPLGALRNSGSGVRNSGSGVRNSGSGVRNSGNGVRNSGSGARNSACGARNSGSGARNSGNGARNSGSGARHSNGSGPRGSGSGSAGLISERPSPGSVGTGGGATMSGTVGYGTEADAYGTDPCEYGEGDEELPEVDEEEIEEEPQEQHVHSGEDTQELHTENDPFGNFSFTNFTGLSAANMEKIQKLREHFNRRTSYSGPGT